MPTAGDSSNVTRTVATVTADAVEAATGRDWTDWLTYLDDAVDQDADPSAVLAAVRTAGVDNGWWQQTVARGYAIERNGHADAARDPDAFGVQRTVRVDRGTLWTYLVGDGVATWLGETTDFAPVPRVPYETADGTTGEVRTVAEGERLALTWKPDRLPDHAMLHLTLATPPGTATRTVLRAHLEDLPPATARDDLRVHWQAVLDRLQADVTD